MYKFEHIKSYDELMAMGDENVVEFVNKANKKIKSGEMKASEISKKYGFQITKARQYVIDNYKSKAGIYYFNKPRTKKSEVEEKRITIDQLLLEKVVTNGGSKRQVSKIMYDSTLQKLESVCQRYPAIDKKDILDIALQFGLDEMSRYIKKK